MGVEIERKFLVTGDGWRNEATEALLLRQGYLSTAPECAVRVRISGDAAWLTVKGRSVNGSTPEFEYAVPLEDAASMLDLLAKKPLIEKRRHLVPKDGLVWEVDEFFGRNEGLVIAELELPSLDQAVSFPAWVGREVTGDIRYYNASLVASPFQSWPEKSAG